MYVKADFLGGHRPMSLDQHFKRDMNTYAPARYRHSDDTGALT